MPNVRITNTALAGLPPDTTLRDTVTQGFEARRRKSAAVSFSLWYRSPQGASRRVTIGIWGKPWTVEQARKKAAALLLTVKGDAADPAEEKKAKRQAQTVDELCDAYIAAMRAGQIIGRGGTPKAQSTIDTDVSRIDSHIRPLLGKRILADVTTADVMEFRNKVAAGATAKKVKLEKKHATRNIRGGTGTAARTLSLLGAMLTWARKMGLRTGENPARDVEGFADRVKDRRLSEGEYADIGLMLTQLPGRTWKLTAPAIRFLALTGWRLGEVVKLRRGEVDLATGTAVLPTTKTGRSMRPIGAAARAILESLPGKSGTLYFPSEDGDDKPVVGLGAAVRKVAKKVGLTDVTAHTFRHSFATTAAELGYADSTIGALLGHARSGITQRYIHSADAVLVASANEVAETIRSKMESAL
jgi:integrase